MIADLLQSDETTTLARELSALTGETASAAVAAALREHLQRTRQTRQRRAWTDRAEVLSRALRVSNGPGIPVNHCWGESDRLPE